MNKNLDPYYYVKPEYFEAESEKLFSQSWQLLGPASRVEKPGQYVSEDISGMKVLIIRDNDAVLRGFRNVCRHRGAQLLASGAGECRTIRCPYHNWIYDLDGSLNRAPWFGDDPDFDPADWPLETVQIEEWRGLLFICINPVSNLHQQLGATCSELGDIPIEGYSCMKEERLCFDSNWKVYTDNFVEGYHIPGIHPEFHAAIDFEQFETTARDGLVKMTAPAKRDLFYKGRWYWMWPNWTLSLFDGGMNTSRINPLSHDKTELIYHFYFAQDSETTEKDRAQTIERNLEVIKQDFQICRETHNNYLTEAYTPGPLSPRHEKGVMYFQQRYKSLMDANG